MESNSLSNGGVPDWMAVGLVGAYLGGVLAVTLMAALGRGPVAALPFFLVSTVVAVTIGLLVRRRFALTAAR
jgi:uncharacterized membrane protein YeaQ/YmgE (transglycosylase-associated protein family)